MSNRIAKYFLLMVLCSIMYLSGCQKNQVWEYKVVQFSRDDYALFELTLAKLGYDKWEYAGPLCNNGLNAELICFKRIKE